MSKSNGYYKKYDELIVSLKVDDVKLDEVLDRLTGSIFDAYSKGSLNTEHFDRLRNQTSILYEEIFRNKISSLNNNSSNNKITKEQLAQIRNDVEEAYSQEKIKKEHYHSLSERISTLQNKQG